MVSVVGFYKSEDEKRMWVKFGNEFEAVSIKKLFALKSRVSHLENISSVVRHELFSMSLYKNNDFFKYLSEITWHRYAYVIYDRYYCFVSHRRIKDAKIQKILIPHDSYSLACERAIKVEKKIASKISWFFKKLVYIKLEKQAKVQFDLIMPVSKVDVGVFEQYPGKAKIADFGIPISKKIWSVTHSYREDDDKLNILIHGSFGVSPVYQSFVDCFDRVYSRIRHNYPQVEFTIWSRNFHSCISDLSKLNGVKIVTWVDDYYSMLNSADIYLYPQIYCSGIQTKLRDAMAIGLPCVARAETLVPLLVTGNNIAYCVNNDDEMIDALSELIESSDRRRIVGENAKRHIFDNFNDANLKKKLYNTIDSLSSISKSSNSVSL